MFARMCYASGLLIGSAMFLLSGCQATQSIGNPGAAKPIMAKLPDAESSDMPEAPPQEILPDTHVAAGRLHESQGKLARAAEQYRLAIGAKPDHVEAHNRLGQVLDRLGKYREADQAFLRAVQLAPKRGYLHNNLAFSYTMQARWPEAEAELNKAIALEPGFPRAHVNLGMVLAQQGRYEQSLRQFRQVLSTEDAYYNLGLMYQSKKLPVEAAQAFRQALAANPKMAAAQKRMDLLPPGSVSEAAQRGALFVQVMALTGDAAKTKDIATRPASASEADEISILVALAAQPEDDMPLAATQPACEEEPQGAVAPTPSDLLIPDGAGWWNRDMIPHVVEDQLVWDALIPDEDAIDDQANETMRTRTARWGRIQTLIQEIRTPLESLMVALAARSEESSQSGSPSPVQIPEAIPSTFIGPPADCLEP